MKLLKGDIPNKAVQLESNVATVCIVRQTNRQASRSWKQREVFLSFSPSLSASFSRDSIRISPRSSSSSKSTSCGYIYRLCSLKPFCKVQLDLPMRAVFIQRICIRCILESLECTVNSFSFLLQWHNYYIIERFVKTIL
jgi:hypothetical protein